MTHLTIKDVCTHENYTIYISKTTPVPKEQSDQKAISKLSRLHHTYIKQKNN